MKCKVGDWYLLTYQPKVNNAIFLGIPQVCIQDNITVARIEYTVLIGWDCFTFKTVYSPNLQRTRAIIRQRIIIATDRSLSVVQWFHFKFWSLLKLLCREVNKHVYTSHEIPDNSPRDRVISTSRPREHILDKKKPPIRTCLMLTNVQQGSDWSDHTTREALLKPDTYWRHKETIHIDTITSCSCFCYLTWTLTFKAETHRQRL